MLVAETNVETGNSARAALKRHAGCCRTCELACGQFRAVLAAPAGSVACIATELRARCCRDGKKLVDAMVGVS